MARRDKSTKKRSEVAGPACEGKGGSDDGGWLTASAFLEEAEALPLAVQIPGAAFAAAGWLVGILERRTFCDYAPALCAERNGRWLWIYVREAIEGFCAAPDWRKDRVTGEVGKHAAAQGIEILHLTVHLAPCGSRRFDVSIDGLGDLAGEIRPMPDVARPEIVGPEDEPVFDETDAARTFARCMNGINLEEFSAMLVEDAELHSRPTRKKVRGRLAILSYLGTKLELWKVQQQSPNLKVGEAVVNGRRRPCTLLFPAGQRSPNNCTVFEGRRGRVAKMQAYNPAKLEHYEVLGGESLPLAPVEQP